MITPEQRREIKRLVNDIASSQVALAFNPDDRQTKRSASKDIEALNTFLSSITKETPC